MLKEFIDYINNLKVKSKTIVEFGPGKSTKLFANKFNKIISYEDNIDYLNTLDIWNNVEYKLLRRNKFALKDIINDIKKADYIYIDNNPNYIKRETLLYLSYKYSRVSCIVILDNGNWNKKAYNFLKLKYYTRDFIGYRNKKDLVITTVGLKRI